MMSDENSKAPANHDFFPFSFGTTMGLLLLGCVVGFVFLGVKDPGAAKSLFDDFCRAIGIIRN